MTGSVADPGRKPLTGDTVTIKPGTLGRLPVVPGGGGASGSITLDTTDGVVSLTCTGTLTIDAGSTVSAIGDASADAATLSGTVTAAGAITFTCSNAGPANGLIISANVTGGAGALIQFTGSENILVSGTLLNGGGNPVTVNMTAETDVVTFSGINTYAGLLTLTQGELVLANAAAEGTGAAGIKLEAGILNLGFGYSDDLGGAITLGQWLKCTNKNHCCLMMR